jgi:hypothetical protein
MVKSKTAPATVPISKMKPPVLIKRIGSTTFTVNIHFSDAGNETVEDKIFRLIEREASNIA